LQERRTGGRVPEFRKIEDRYYISTSSSMIDPHRLILKDGDLFGVFDRYGDIYQVGRNEQGLYYGGTRFLSAWSLRINGLRPLFLSSNVDEDDILLTVDLTNPDIKQENGIIRRSSLHIMRSRIIYGHQCHEHLRVKNFSEEAVDFRLEVSMDADFMDIFEVRGARRRKRGKLHKPEHDRHGMRLIYEGLDGIKRTTTISCSKGPDAILERTFIFNMKLRPDSVKGLYFKITCIEGSKVRRGTNFEASLSRMQQRRSREKGECAYIYTSNEQFNESIKRAVSDINMMLTNTGKGIYPYGGIPWYSTPFGRDGIITALEFLWMNPFMARDVLRYLACYQGKDFDKKKLEEPGKIVHEIRSGEMADLGEIPFRLYYGSVDSTPLFLILASEYWKRTGDADFIKGIWKNIEGALVWIDRYGDVDNDGFVEYTPDEDGLMNQGWRDSWDAVFHEDGSLLKGDIALCEVQGYVYGAKRGIAELARALGKEEMAGRLFKESEELKERFDRYFWDDELGSYVLALDGKKKPCRVVCSTAGHALFTGIAREERAERLVLKLLSESLFSGWGIRTISTNEARYNPMSYHNGSVWPHDNALIAWGLASYGFKKEMIKVFSAIFDASLFMEFQRLPELFCGFHRRKGVSPTLYPAACSPQTWASGSLILMLQASLGLSFKAERQKILFKQPILPEFLNHIYLRNLKVTADKSIDLLLRRYGNDVTVEILKKPDDVSVLIEK
jgi:glycogen debranching enzyme